MLFLLFLPAELDAPRDTRFLDDDMNDGRLSRDFFVGDGSPGPNNGADAAVDIILVRLNNLLLWATEDVGEIAAAKDVATNP